MKKLIACDMDGTLISSNGKVTDINLEYISRLKSVGYGIVPASGRTLYEIPSNVREHKDIEYIIYANGAGIYSKARGNVYYDPIPNEVKCSIMSMLLEYDTYIELYSMGHVYDDKLKYGGEAFDYYGVDEYFKPELYISREPIADFNNYAYSGEHFVEMFNVYFHNKNEREECWHRLQELKYPVELTSSMTTNIEITHSGVSKGNALKKLCEIINFDIKSVIAVGDSGNDVTMFKLVRESFAVANACDRLKQIATKIICSNDDNIMEYIYNNL